MLLLLLFTLECVALSAACYLLFFGFFVLLFIVGIRNEMSVSSLFLRLTLVYFGLNELNRCKDETVNS